MGEEEGEEDERDADVRSDAAGGGGEHGRILCAFRLCYSS